MNVKKIVYSSLFIAIGVVITRFFSIHTPIVRIGFGFIATMMSGVFFGPIWGGVTSALIDFIGANVFPTGTYFVGFTISSFVSGVIYGLCFYKKKITYRNVVASVILQVVLVSTIMNTLWLSIMTGKGFVALMPVRLIKNLIFIPIQSVTFISLVYSIRNTSIVKRINHAVG